MVLVVGENWSVVLVVGTGRWCQWWVLVGGASGGYWSVVLVVGTGPWC